MQVHLYIKQDKNRTETDLKPSNEARIYEIKGKIHDFVCTSRFLSQIAIFVQKND